VPAFPTQRPPFARANGLAVRHGVYSARKVNPLARQFVDGVLADESIAYLREPKYTAALWSWARDEARCVLLDEYLAAAGELTGDGVGDLESSRVLAAYALQHRVEMWAMSGRARLGLDPLSESRLRRDRAAASVDMARLMAELARRDQQSGGGGDIVEGEVGGDG
jgi:hypothetical protein